MCVCVLGQGCVHKDAVAWTDQKREIESLELELQTAVNLALNQGAQISLASEMCFSAPLIVTFDP